LQKSCWGVMLASKVKRTALSIVIALTVLAIGYSLYTMESARRVEISSLCPITNTSTSFCIVKDGKPYYFAIEGWDLPLVEEVKSAITTGLYGYWREAEGLYVWLKVRTNLDLEFDADNNGYVMTGERYKEVLFGDPYLLIRRGSDVVLLPYRFSNWREDVEALLKAEKLRLYFDVEGYDVLPTSGCIGEICFTAGHHGPGFYVNFTPPPTVLRVLDIEGRCVDEDLCLYNVTFGLKDGYIFLPFLYDPKTGIKTEASFPMPINVYVMKGDQLVPTDEPFPSSVVPPLPPTAIDV